MDLIPPSPGLELATFPARARGLCGLAWPVPVVALGPGRWQWWLCGTVSPPGHPSLTCCSQFCLVLVQKAGPVPACEPGTRRRLYCLRQLLSHGKNILTLRVGGEGRSGSSRSPLL